MKKPVIPLLCALLVLSCLTAAPAAAAALPGRQISQVNYFYTNTPAPTLNLFLFAVPLVTAAPAEAHTIGPVDVWQKPSLLDYTTPEPAPTPASTRWRKATPTPEAEPQTGQVFTSFGLYWREVLPRVTEEWYMFTPLDLSAQGEQVYPLVASNRYIIGQVKLTLASGTLRADCEVIDGVKVLSEFLTFFPSLDSVRTINLALLSNKNFPFRSPIDIQSAFGGDRRVLMYINCGVAFDLSLPGLSAFDAEVYRPWMQDMLSLMD